MSEINIKHSFLPFLRRGLSQQIDEKDTLLIGGKEGSALKRAKIKITSEFELQQVDVDKEPKTRKESILIDLVGPGEVLGVQEMAIKQIVPAEDVKNFESNFLPFIEFIDEDLPWRYSPVRANSDKLRPWMALIICKNDEFELDTNSDGKNILTLKIDNQNNFQNILGDPAEIWKNAHVQFPNQAFEKKGNSTSEKQKNLSEEVEDLLKRDGSSGFSRILAHRKLEDNQAYTAFLIPTFETGRRAGLGLEIDDIPAQRAAWEKDYDQHKTKRENPFHFPVYYQWNFETSTGDFIVLAKKLNPIPTSDLPVALDVDVQNMGNGLNYSTLEKQPRRKTIEVAVATTAADFKETVFPTLTDEKVLFDRIKDLLSKSPDLQDSSSSSESGKMILKRDFRKTLYAGKFPKTEEKSEEENEFDDPWIVPPVYGAKHVLATSLEKDKNKNHPWFDELNINVNHRAAAGLGKKVIQQNQEEFVHRAWEQVELIQELNQLLREHILKYKVNRSIYNTNFSSVISPSSMIVSLNFMKNSELGEATFKEKLIENEFPLAYSSTVFNTLSSKRILPKTTNTESLTKTVVDNIVFKKHKPIGLMGSQEIKSLIERYFNRVNILNVIKYL